MQISRNPIILVLLYSLLLMLMAGCSSLNSTAGGLVKADTDLKLKLLVDSDVNPDDNKKPSPLFIRMYELKSTKQFEKADFIALFERDEEVLGADLVGKQVLKRIKPGESRKEHYKKLSKDTRFVGLYAEFLQYKDAKYKAIIPVSANNLFANSKTVQISGNTITVVE